MEPFLAQRIYEAMMDAYQLYSEQEYIDFDGVVLTRTTVETRVGTDPMVVVQYFDEPLVIRTSTLCLIYS